jgi:hypothetical protein
MESPLALSTSRFQSSASGMTLFPPQMSSSLPAVILATTPSALPSISKVSGAMLKGTVTLV